MTTNLDHPTSDPAGAHLPPTGQGPAGADGQRVNRQQLVTAVAGGVLAITAFLGGAAVGHAWDGGTTTGPGNGRFGPGTFPNGPGNGVLPGQTNPQGPTTPQGQTQHSGSDTSDPTVSQVAWISVPAVQTGTTSNAPASLDLYGLWRLPARVPDSVTVRGRLEPA